MAVSDRTAGFVLITATVGLVLVAGSVDLPRLSGGRFWGDGATYYSMAWSLARDGDLQYELKDLERVKREYPEGPQGIFLKRASGGVRFDQRKEFPWFGQVPADQPRIYYAKPFVYPMVAAPLVRWFGTRGLLVTNALALAATFAAGFGELRRRTTAGRALAVASVLVFLTVAPIYLIWPAPELLNMALIAAGLVAWRRDRPLLSAIALGVATYSKPYNLWLAVPLGIAPLTGESGWKRGVIESLRRGVTFAATVALLFGVNKAITGEANYQGGAERKTFYRHFPGEVEIEDGTRREITFGNSGTWMSTNSPGPRVEGISEAAVSQGAEPPRSSAEIRDSFLRNLGYFWIGRFGGAVWYFFPACLTLAVFIFLGPRDTGGWLAVAALLVSFLFYLIMIPDNWYGGSGTLGNRYFLNLLPLAFLLVPRGREKWTVIAGAAGSAIFVVPLLASPLNNSFRHGIHATRGIYTLMPAELTMLNDLSVFSEPWRKKQPVGDTEGDPWRHWPADPKAYYLYFPDNGTYGKDEGPGGTGFWLRGDASAEVFLRALEPVKRMRFHVTGGPGGDEVTIQVGRVTQKARVTAATGAGLEFEPGAGFVYKDTFVYVLTLRSRDGGSMGADGRRLGSFIRISLEVNRRPRPRANPVHAR